MATMDRRQRATGWMRWLARIWSLPITIYAAFMVIGYVWNWVTTGMADPHAVQDYPAIEAVPPILMMASAVALGSAWRWERLGGAVALLLQVAVVPFLLIQTPLTRDFPRTAIPYVISLGIAIPSVLFLLCGRRSSAASPVVDRNAG